MWRANGNPNPYTDLDELLHAHLHLSKEGFGPGFTPAPSPPGPGGLETLKAEGHIFKMLSWLQQVPQLKINNYLLFQQVRGVEGM